MKVLTFILVITGMWNHLAPVVVSAQTNQQKESLSCSNDECYTTAENLLLVAGLITATTAPRFLLPKSSHSFLTKSPGHVALGGFISNTRMARMGIDYSAIPDVIWGINTSLTLADLKDGDLASLRYEVLMEWPFYQTDDSRWSFDLGMAVEKLLEKNEILAGAPLGLRWQSHLLGKWKLESTVKGYLFKKPTYRGEVSLIYSSPNGLSSLVGYQLEDNRQQNVISQYLFVGFLL